MKIGTALVGGLLVLSANVFAQKAPDYLFLNRSSETLMDDATKYPIAGKIAWITPAGANNNKAQGIGVHFSSDESGLRVRQPASARRQEPPGLRDEARPRVGPKARRPPRWRC